MRSFLWTNASVFVVTEHMAVLAFHAFSGLSNPEVRRVTPYADIICCQVWSLNGTFTFSFFHVINKSLWTRFTLETDIVPEVWTITSNTDIVLSVRFVRGALALFSQGVVNLLWWTNNTNHSSLVVMRVLWTTVTFIILKEWSWLGAWGANCSDSIVDLFIWTLKTSSLICVPITWLDTLNTFDTSIKWQIIWALASSAIFVVYICFWTALAFFTVIIPEVWVVTWNAFSILLKRSLRWASTGGFSFAKNVSWRTHQAFWSQLVPIFWGFACDTLIKRQRLVWSYGWTDTLFLIKVIFKGFRARKTCFLLLVPKIRRIAANTFWTNHVSVFGANTSHGSGFKNKSRRTAFAGFGGYIKNSASRTSHTLLAVPDWGQRRTSDTFQLAFRIMRIGRTLFTRSCIFIPMFWPETVDTLKASIIGQLLRTDTFSLLDIKLIGFRANEAHSCGLIPVMRVVASNALSIVFIRCVVGASALLAISAINISVWAMGAGAWNWVPVVWIGTGNAPSGLKKWVSDRADAASFVRVILKGLWANLAVTCRLVPVVWLLASNTFVVH